MSEAKPLHVQVAEALGWTHVHYRMESLAHHLSHSCGDIMIPDPERMRWKGRKPGEMLVGAEGCNIIPRYDTDWSATGPMIEKWRFDSEVRFDALCHQPNWCALYIPPGDDDIIEAAKHPTLLIAVCNLILALKATGKL